MKTQRMILLLLLVMSLGASIIAQEYSEERMKELFEMMNPGAEHDILKSMREIGL